LLLWCLVAVLLCSLGALVLAGLVPGGLVPLLVAVLTWSVAGRPVLLPGGWLLRFVVAISRPAGLVWLVLGFSETGIVCGSVGYSRG
jgi:hypothetical protein